MGYNLDARGCERPGLRMTRHPAVPRRPRGTAAFALWALWAAAPASAAPPQPFDEAAFGAAQQAGRAVVLHFNAASCGVCDEQTKALERLLRQPLFESFSCFQADFDTSAGLAESLRVTGRGAMILFRGRSEIAREAGLVSEADIRAFLLRALERRRQPRPRPRLRTPPKP